MKTSEKLLSVNDLTVHFDTDEGIVEAVNDVSLDIRRGEIVGLVGESGSGKTVTAQSILRLVPRPPARFVKGKAIFNREDLLTLPIERLRQIRGAEISMIFQEPMTALSPLHKDRPTTQRDVALSYRHGPGIDLETQYGMAGEGRPPRPGAADVVLSSSFIRRYAPARHDCHGPDAETAADHRG